MKTLALIKPDITCHRPEDCGDIIKYIVKHNFCIEDIRIQTWTRDLAETFYAEHKERPFFSGLCTFMTSGPVWALRLDRADAVKTWRTLMGATNPAEAHMGTLRCMYGASIDHNALHGSDSETSAARELSLVF